MVIGEIVGRLHYVVILALAVTGIGLAVSASNLMRRIVGLVMAWTGLVLFFAGAAITTGGGAPIVVPNEAYDKLYANPLPQAMMLGATVSGAAMILLALALVIRIRESYGGVEMDEIAAADTADDAGERDPT